MRLSRTPKFFEDYDELSCKEQGYVDEAYPFVYKALHGNQEYRSKYRLKRMEGHPKIWEGHVKDNLVFTFEFEKDSSGNKTCFFRRVGTHDIYKNP